MRIETIDGIEVLYADEGKRLSNGESHGKEVWLGINDNRENWEEVEEDELSIDESE